MRVMNFRATRWMAVLIAGATTVATQSAPAQTPNADGWLTFKGDAQRTNSRSVRLGTPLNLLWRHSTTSPPGEFVTSPLVTGTPEARRIFFSTGDAMYCIDSATGAQVWRSEMAGVGGNIVSPITMLRDQNIDLILGVTSGNSVNIIAVRASDGSLAWQTPAKAQVTAGVPTIITTTRGPRIIAAIGDSRLVALTPQGAVDPGWAVRLGRRIADPSSAPALSPDGKRIFITARDRNVYALDAETGTTAYTIELESSAQLSPVVVRDSIVLISEQTMSGHAVADGKRLWSLDLRDSVLASPAAMTSGDRSTIYIGSRNGTLSAINATNGQVLWSINLEASITATPTVLSDLILVGTGTGLLMGVKPEDGSIVWQYRLHTTRTVPAADTAVAAIPFITANAQFGPGVGTTAPGTPDPGFPTTPVPGFPGPGTAVPPVPDALTPALVTQTFGISATPVVVGDKLFVLGDNAALYAFDATVRDVLPPRPVAPSLSSPSDQGQLLPALLESGTPRAIPGQAPIYFAVELSDTGSGVNPSTIQVTLNRQPVPPQRIVFQKSSGVLTVTMAEKVPLNKGNLPDGQYTVNVIARDYHNNEMNYTTSFMIDNSLALPSAAPPQPVFPTTPPPVAPGFGGGGFGGVQP